MLRFFVCLSIAFAMLGAACSKNNEGREAVLYGTWVNSHAPGDTLLFMRKSGKNILRFNASFNTSLPAWSEMEYSYINGKLAVAMFGPPLKEIDSFTWKQQDREFDILGFQLYMIMSSSTTHFTYTKIN